MPVSRNAHHPQLPLTPCSRTSPVTKFGVSVEKVVATMLIPNNHHGILRPARKKLLAFLPASREAHKPMTSARAKYPTTIAQSSVVSSMLQE